MATFGVSGSLPRATTNAGAGREPLIAQLSGTQSTQNLFDPTTQIFITNLLKNSDTQTKSFNVSLTTLGAIESLLQNPGQTGDIAGQQFGQISRSLLQSLEGVNKQEQQGLSDLFRKAGVGTQQSGAFAQAARQLVGDQGNRANQLLASNYVPLLNSATQARLGSINAGLAVPAAQSAGQQGLNQILNTLVDKPTNVNTTTTQQQLVGGNVGLANLGGSSFYHK